jgi:hypothetical protein
MWHKRPLPQHVRAGDGISESVLIVIPPAGSSDGSWKLLMVTPGKLLKAFKVMVFVRDTLSNIVPRAVTRRLDVEMVQSKLGLWSK